MSPEAEHIIAFLFKRSGKKTMTFPEIYLTLSMDLNWYTPEGAKKFVNTAIQQQLLTKKDDMIRPSFDIKNIQIPVGFQPSKTIFTEEKNKKSVEEETSVLEQIITHIKEKTSLDKQEIIDKIKELEKEKNITPEVASILIGKENNVSLEMFYKKIEEKCFQ